jgi:hypothetical protein
MMVTTNVAFVRGKMVLTPVTNPSLSGLVVTVDLEAVQQYRDRRRQELKASGEAQDIAAKEVALKERAERVTLGMSLLQVVEVMGSPDAAEVRMQQDPEFSVMARVPFGDLERYPNTDLFLYYSPYATVDEPRASAFPFEQLRLVFDAAHVLEEMHWF